MVSAVSPSSSLLMRAKAREPQAWMRLVSVFGPLVYRWCRAGGLQPDDAREVGQEVFAAVAQGIEKFRRSEPGDSFRAWLKAITRYKLADFHRARSKDPVQAGSGVADVVDRCAAEAGDAESAEINERTYIVQNVLAWMKGEFEPHTWTAFWRFTVEGHPSTEVADDLGMTPEAVRQAKFRVLRRLRHELEGLVDLGPFEDH